MKLGMVTYQIAKDWDVSTIIDTCRKSGFAGVELRTTHAHGVEFALSAEGRTHVKRQFEEAGIELAGLGSTFEYHSTEPAVVRENIAGTIAYAQLASDVGCPGVKVRPNGVHTDEGIPLEQTLEQIGLAVRECAQAAGELGVQIRVEVHGKVTSEPRNMCDIMGHADHSNAYVCWNSNFGEVIDGSIKENFDLLKHRIGLVHITELSNPAYPWRELFTLLNAEKYQGFTLAEIPSSTEPERLLGYYRALWKAYTG